MRALAELVMRGQKHAAVVAVVAALLPLLYWISAAAVALVTLRRGPSDGAGLLVWAILPAGVWTYSGDPTPLVVIAGTYVLAILLRQTVSWPRVLMLALPLGALMALLLETALSGVIGQMVEMTQQLLEQSTTSAEADKLLTTETLNAILVGGLSAVHTAMILLSLILARSWQSGLYNPGGFQQEFHQMRLPATYTALLLAALVLGSQVGLEIWRWLPLVLLPWIICGIALIHGSVAKRDLGRSWLVGFYLAVVFFGPYMILLLVAAAVLDSFVDFRSRMPVKN
ncbi:hypothetical protein ACFVYJ_06830 [Pontibacter sp. JAM-7]|uniref:hypothetical protein n=1 Tax=Pontibacter sp. JAM-7 TaxID=3366581 RepID=UPI003AF7D698